jgi:iron complex outermembrane receptor protein
MIKLKTSLLTAIYFAVLMPAISDAQISTSAPPAPPPVIASSLQPIVITARHRTERAQSVPISLTVVDARQLKTLGSINLNKIKELVPTLTINSFNPRNAGIDIRGLGSVGFYGYDGLEDGVGVYIDGVLQGRTVQANFDLPDLQDIEVLRGPQGTLFGKNAVAGAINITTKLPSFKPETDFSASLGNYNYWQLQGYATSALFGGDKAAVSLSVHDTQRDGFIKSTVTNQSYDNEDDKGLRAQVLLQPNANLTVRIIADYDHQDSNCCANTPTGLFTNYANGAHYATLSNPSIITRLGTIGYNLPAINPFGRTTDVNSWTHYAMETGGLSAQADYNLGGLTLTSITAASYYNWYPHLDADGIGVPLLTASNNTTHQRQFSQELRLSSPLGGKIDYTGGIYFFYQQLNDQAINQFGANAAGLILNEPLTSTNAIYNIYNNALSNWGSAATDIAETYSGAAYGQATWHITPKLDLTSGARFTYEDKTGDYYQVQQGGVAVATSSTSQNIRNEFFPAASYQIQHSNMLPGGLVTLSYKPAPNILNYISYSHGEKSAGLNFVSNPIIPKIVAPEKVDNFEIGAKTTLLNNHLLLDGDAFWTEDTDYQSTVIGPASRTPYLANVPKVRSRGIEVDAHELIGQNLTLFASGTFDDAYYESNPSAACPAELSNASPTCNLTGKPLAGSSKWTASLGGEDDQPLPEYRGHATIAYFGGDILLRSNFYSTSDDSKYSNVPGYGIANIRFGIKQANGAWDLSGWIDNVTNTRYYIFRYDYNQLPLYNLLTGQVGDPLTFGVTLRAKFE